MQMARLDARISAIENAEWGQCVVCFLVPGCTLFYKTAFFSCNQTPPNVLTWVAMAKYFACLQQCPQMTLLDLSQCLANAQILTQVGNGDQPYWFRSPNILVIPAHRRKRINVHGFMQLAKIVPCFFWNFKKKIVGCTSTIFCCSQRLCRSKNVQSETLRLLIKWQ